MKVIALVSPNQNARPDGVEPDAIVLHCDASAHVEGTVSWLTSPTSKVSYHTLFDRDGATYWTFVPTTKRAWHAGASTFDGRPNCNDYSVGVAFANANNGEPYGDAMLHAAAVYCAGLMHKHPLITLERITTHAIVSPGRKTDPVPPFDLAAFRAMVAAELTARRLSAIPCVSDRP
jgi:N-acetyl-anhydromuramyl-L-alanine amidase AmpD